MDSLIFELQIILHFQLFLSANVRHTDEAPRGKRENTSGIQGNRNIVTILIDVDRLFRPFFWRD